VSKLFSCRSLITWVFDNLIQNLQASKDLHLISKWISLSVNQDSSVSKASSYELTSRVNSQLGFSLWPLCLDWFEGLQPKECLWIFILGKMAQEWNCQLLSNWMWSLKYMEHFPLNPWYTVTSWSSFTLCILHKRSHLEPLTKWVEIAIKL
jgi:hypothetical protein